jgi:hypothetical protein
MADEMFTMEKSHPSVAQIVRIETHIAQKALREGASRKGRSWDALMLLAE